VKVQKREETFVRESFRERGEDSEHPVEKRRERGTALKKKEPKSPPEKGYGMMRVRATMTKEKGEKLNQMDRELRGGGGERPYTQTYLIR